MAAITKRDIVNDLTTKLKVDQETASATLEAHP
jgi:hypothetical protein